MIDLDIEPEFPLNQPDYSYDQKLTSDIKENQKLADKLYRALNGDLKHKPRCIFQKSRASLKAMYHPDVLMKLDKSKHMGPYAYYSANKSNFNDTIIAHELAHSTGWISPNNKHTKLRKAWHTLYSLGAHPASYIASPLVQVYGGTPGEILTYIPTLANLLEEGQAYACGLHALKKVNGKLRPANIGAAALGMGSYLGGAAVKHLVLPKLVSNLADSW